MSHTTTIKGVPLKSVSAIRSAVNNLAAKGINIGLAENAVPRMYYSDQFKRDTGKSRAELVLQLPGSKYDVGLSLQEDGTYQPVLDTWAGSVSGQIGATCPVPSSPEGRAQHAIGQFMQEYAKEAAIEAAVMAGHTVESCTVDAEGNVQLKIAVA
jgi:hypothetical protein